LEYAYKNRSFLIGVRDCYSLIRDFYNKELGIELNDFYRNTKESKEEIIKNLGFREIDKNELKRNDIILLKDNSVYSDITITIYLGGDNILGHFDTTSSYKSLLNNVNNIYKVLRHEKFN
jgi:cell wall-associated NlpC family hydrolase